MIVVLLQSPLKDKLLIFLINTLLLHIPLLALTDRQNDRQRGKYTRCTLAGGTFSSCTVVSVFGSGRKQVLVLHPYVLRVQYSIGVVLVFWFLQEIVFGVTQVLRAQYSCVVVSVFWLWREIVLTMRTCFYGEKNLGYFIMIRQPMLCVYFIRPSTLLLCIFLFCIFLLYHPDPQAEVQIRILLTDIHRKSCQKSKHQQSHFDFLNNAYLVSLFQRNNSLAKICFS